MEIEKHYDLDVDGVRATVLIEHKPSEFVPLYTLSSPSVEPATQAVLDAVKEKLITELDLRPAEVIDPAEVRVLKKKFLARSQDLIKAEIPGLSKEKLETLAGLLTHHSLGLGVLEVMLQDPRLEEIVVNGAKQPVWVYHRQMGWLKTNVVIATDAEIYNYAASIGRRVGSQITYLNPLMDAYLPSGDRSNATLFPISSSGNTLTIRKFASRPWTITDFLESSTISYEIAAFLWLAIQYEMNMIISGGTASGKTSLLNVIACFIPPTHRILSIEDTREIQLPQFLHWVPLTTRPSNPEGKGEVTMLELMINTLRMRPDRILVGEIRRSREAEVLFEAIHTGHSVYSTLHANTAQETVRRLTNPPIDIPPTLLSSLQIVVAMHRDRRRDVRRVFQVAELLARDGGTAIDVSTVFGWNPSTDKLVEMKRSVRVLEEIKFYTGMTDDDIKQDLDEKASILKWMVKQQIKDVNKVGEVVSRYYTDKAELLRAIRRGG
ncbi:MAG: CpaF family protein [Candidatus Aenigmarchaeota archaeon]|nr:CpaF family protein [Candidatus Aenigmarchaeota archaeon]